MSKSVTVNFADGTTHVYDDVPDEVSNDEVNQRAQQDFSKPIEAVGAPSPTEKATENYNNSSMLDKILGAVPAGANLAGQALTSPVGVAAEALLGKKFLYDPLVDAIKNRGGPIAPQTMPPAVAPAQQATGTYGKPNLTLQQGGIAPNAGQQAFNQMGQQLTKTPLPSPSMMQQGMNYAKQMQQIAASKVMPALNFASKAIIPAQIAMGVGYTSPEEIAILKAAEARKRAQGWKPLNER